jgi:peptidoglycan/xylan/chitin deacetylase (PgdA/CDA1 family)
MGKREQAASIMGGALARRVWSATGGRDRSLRILAYHRVLDDDPDDFAFDDDLISATTEDFRRQMEFARQNFNVISFRDLEDPETGNGPWPERALVVTFDDGYRDNYTQAFPILKELGLPATIFLITGHMDRSELFWWDLMAFCFRHTPLRAATLAEVAPTPLPLSTREERRDALRRTLSWIKLASEETKSDFLSRLPGVLDVSPPSHTERMHLSWDEVCEMARHGIEFGSHTVTHPVLSQVGEHRLEEEVRQSKRDIEERLGTPSHAFCYPVGEESSYGDDARRAVERAGFRYAVSYREGTATAERFDRYALPRIRVETGYSHKAFRARLMFPRLMLR